MNDEQKQPEPKPRERESNRRERVPFGVPQRKFPDVPDNDGFQYRIINDNWMKDPARIIKAEKGGYEKVEGYDSMNVGTNDDGSIIKGHLMRIPKEWYDEDQKEKRKEVDRVDEAIKAGTLEQKARDNRYIPEGIKIYANHHENG